MNKILVIAAHPDDEVLGMGGTIARLTDEGNDVHLLIVTDGSSSQYRDDPNLKSIIDEKKRETAESSRILGIKSITYSNLPDMKLDSIPHVEVNKAIEEVVERLQPDTVYTHFWGDVNMDHQRVYQSTLVAVRPTANQSVHAVYCYSVPSSTEWSPYIPTMVFMPNLFVSIEKYVEVKKTALSSYTTELRPYPHPRSIEYIQKQDEAVGLRGGMGPVERFVLLRKSVV
jgi:LmbE family N-acetylglucosaminyl deacetylase